MVSLLQLLQKSNKLKLSEVRCLEEVEKFDDPSYYLLLALRPLALSFDDYKPYVVRY